jgi:hypothetical protein
LHDYLLGPRYCSHMILGFVHRGWWVCGVRLLQWEGLAGSLGLVRHGGLNGSVVGEHGVQHLEHGLPVVEVVCLAGDYVLDLALPPCLPVTYLALVFPFGPEPHQEKVRFVVSAFCFQPVLLSASSIRTCV